MIWVELAFQMEKDPSEQEGPLPFTLFQYFVCIIVCKMLSLMLKILKLFLDFPLAYGQGFMKWFR